MAAAPAGEISSRYPNPRLAGELSVVVVASGMGAAVGVTSSGTGADSVATAGGV